MHYGVIAAGEGSRLAGEGASCSKPLIEIDGKPMIERLIGIMTECDAESISLIVNEQMTQVQEFVRALAQRIPVPLHITVKSTPSSMHSFYEVTAPLRDKGRFVVTTVDTIFRPDDFHRYVRAFASASYSVDGLMGMTSYIDDEKPLYIETDAEDNIIAFRDTAWEGVKYVSGGIYGLNGAALDVLDDCMAHDVNRMRNFQRALVEAGLQLKGFDFGKILDVDHLSDILKAQRFLDE